MISGMGREIAPFFAFAPGDRWRLLPFHERFTATRRAMAASGDSLRPMTAARLPAIFAAGHGSAGLAPCVRFPVGCRMNAPGGRQ